jgi:CRP-like cAMP-binding protein
MLSINGCVQPPGNISARHPDSPARWVQSTSDAGIRNELLGALPANDLRQLSVRLKRVPLNRRQVIQERNLPARYAYFIERGTASVLARVGDHLTIEVRSLGPQDFVGIPIVLGAVRSPHRCVVQVAGDALRVDAADLVKVMVEFPQLRRILLGYVQAALAHSAQLVACNARHSLCERLARRLLIAYDQLESNEIPFTHDCLGRALCVRRAGVTAAMGRMEQNGLIRLGRGRILIIDRTGLEQTCCGCYRAIRAERLKALSHPTTSAYEVGPMRGSLTTARVM